MITTLTTWNYKTIIRTTLLITPQIRLYHNSSLHHSLSKLYITQKGKKIPRKDFRHAPIQTLLDIQDKKTVSTFFKNPLIKNKGGIYRFFLKKKPNIFYIGATSDFNTRFLLHVNSTGNPKHNTALFHLFARDVGWDKFNFQIVEIVDEIKYMRARENFYLKEHNPILNSNLKSSFPTF